MRPTYFLSWPFSWGCSMGKAPIGWPFWDPSSRMGAPPSWGHLLFLRQIPKRLRYHHRSHTMTTALTHRSLTHTALTHTTLTLLSHYDHQLHCLKKKWHGGSASSTSPRSPDHGSHSVTKGSVVTGGLDSGPPSGGGAAKKMAGVCWVREKEGHAHSSGPPSNVTLQGHWVTVKPNSINCFRNHHR
ncbi:unnamed protein product [Rangifer tarandus platyrhynchus]|uniref:Uncharacterized protein n=1 Tax=Rangifer tarandus platyrhynchus TaxID=3082113 RepID=A0AC59YCP9_RANTA